MTPSGSERQTADWRRRGPRGAAEAVSTGQGRCCRHSEGACAPVPEGAARAPVAARAARELLRDLTNPFALKIRANIDRHGWFVISVGSGADAPHFCYTIGLTEKGLPELIVFGLPLEVGASLLNRIAGKVVAGRVRIGERIRGELRNRDDQDIDVMLRTIPANIAAKFAAQAVNIYNSTASFVMVVYPDRANRLPWEKNFDKSFRRFQPAIWETHS